MTRGVTWQPHAMTAHRRLRAANPDGAKQVAAAVRALADDPTPPDSTPLGRTAFRRLRRGDHRVLYELTPDTIRILHVGTLPPPRH